MPRQADRTREFFAFSEGTPATATTPVVKPHWSCINHSDGGIACDYKIIGAAFKAPLARAHLSGSGKHCGGYVTPQNVCKCGSAESMKFFQRKIEEKAQKVVDDLKIACRKLRLPPLPRDHNHLQGPPASVRIFPAVIHVAPHPTHQDARSDQGREVLRK